MEERISDVIFSEAVRAEQARLGSRPMVARMEERQRWSNEITDDLAAYLASRDSIYIATASAAGQPYIQHRGGALGFLKVLDPRRFAFAEERGNRQYITFGNLSENDRVAVFAMDYPNRQRIKIWGRARVVEPGEGDPALWAALGEGAERAVVITVEAWDANCPQFITPRYTEAEVAMATEGLRQRIAEQAARIAELEARLAGAGAA